MKRRGWQFRTPLWECACGDGNISKVLARYDNTGKIRATDIIYGQDFFSFDTIGDSRSIITNPPFGSQGKDAERFIRHALELTRPVKGLVAMLLRVDFDSAKSRRDIFLDNPAWGTKLILTKRIKWFDEPVPCKKCIGKTSVERALCKNCHGTGMTSPGPSENHAWYIWDWQRHGNPDIDYYIE
jgi:hypothetical protein